MERKKNIYLLGLVSFLNDLSSEIILPVLPFFLQSLGGGGVIIGIIGGFRDFVSNLIKIFSGYFSDKFKKNKELIFTGYFISAVFKLFLSFSRVWEEVFIFTSLERVGKGIRTSPRDSIISKSSEKKGSAFGIHRAFDTAGAITGSVLALFFLWKLKFSYGKIILIASIFSFLSLIPILFVKDVTSEKLKNPTFILSLKSINPDLKKFLMVTFLFNISNFNYMFLMIYSEKFFRSSLKVLYPMILYIFFNIFYALFSVPAGKFSDKFGRKKVLATGYLLFFLTLSVFFISKNIFLFILSFLLYGISNAILDGNQRAFVADLSDESIRGTSYGIYHGLNGFSLMIGNLLAGILWEISPSYMFICGMSVSFLSFLFFSFLRFDKKIHTH